MSQYPEVGFGGARGGSKSFGIAHEALRQCLLYPGNSGAIVRQDLADLKDTTMKVMDEYVLPPYRKRGLEYRWFSKENRPRLEIYLGYTEDGRRIISDIIWRPASDITGLMSGNLGFLGIDEATEVPEEFYLMTSGALGRAQLPDGSMAPRKLFWGSNPGPGWCNKLFPVGNVPKFKTYTTEDNNGDEYSITRAFIPAVPKDNPHLGPAFERHLRAIYPDDWVRRFLEGDWSAFFGQIFVEFDKDKHVFSDCTGFGQKGWKHFLSVDWGYREPTAGLLVSLDYDGNFWVWREHRRKEWRPDQHAPYLQQLKEGLDSAPVELMDPAAVDQSDGVAIMTQFNQQFGFQFRGWMKNKHGADGNIFWAKGLLAAGKIRIHESCRGLIKELEEAVWAENTVAKKAKGEPEPERMKDINDHSIDALFGALQWFRSYPVQFGYSNSELGTLVGAGSDKSFDLTRGRKGGSVEMMKRKRYAESGRGEVRGPARHGWASLDGDDPFLN